MGLPSTSSCRKWAKSFWEKQVNALTELLLIIVLSLLLLPVSQSSLRKPQSHGFTRFFAFEGIVILVVTNLDHWFTDPFSVHQIVSWILLATSLFLALHGFHLLRVIGRPHGGFENTTRLVTAGAYTYIRHPLYASLLAGAWGIFSKDLSLSGLFVCAATTLLLVLTARREERENLERFGTEYASYMAETKMFIPYLF
jgi:protein-S-isoprenylcysteine O-methyltransferase Ste14